MAQKLFDLSGKNALITGATQGLGRAMAVGLAEAGATVVINGRNSQAVASCEEELRGKGVACRGAVFDVTRGDDVEQGIARVEAEVGPIHALINNAGVQRREPLDSLGEADWQTVLDTNLTGVWRLSKAVAKGMIERRAGKIINIASLLSFAARPTAGAYAASKGGVAMLTKAMAVDWASHNIQVNAIAPGYFETAMTEALRSDPEIDAWVRLRTPAGRWGRPEELVGAAVFLASSASDFVTGQVLYVDGGWTANL